MFEDLGYFREYYVNNKFIGSVKCEKDRDKIGYDGRKTEITSIRIILDNKKTIKPNTEITTYIYPLCGKTTNN